MQTVSVKECKSYNLEKIKTLLKESFKECDFKLKKDSTFLLKPNLLTATDPKQAVTTHPIVMKAICEIIKPYAKKIYIGDSSANATDVSLEKCGMNTLSKYAEIINFEQQELVKKTIYNKPIMLPKILFEVDCVINVAKLKTHILTTVTLATKNLYGCIPGKRKAELHKEITNVNEFSKMLIELKDIIKPQINIIDGIIGLEGKGPGPSGNPIKANTLITATSPYSADLAGIKAMGFTKFVIPTIKFDKEEKVKFIGEIKTTNFKPAPGFVKKLTFLGKLMPNKKIKFNDKCVLCRLCEKKCPVKAISGKEKLICDYSKCVKCMCCVEICPHNAIDFK